MAEAVAAQIQRMRHTTHRPPLANDDWDDCIAEFVEAMLRKGGCVLDPASEPCEFRGLVMKSAHDHVIDYLRKWVREHRYQCSWPEAQSEDGSFVPLDCPDPSPLPEEIACRSEFRRLIESAGEGLTPLQRDLFYRHDLNGELISDIAASLHKTEKAVEEALRRARRRIQSKLAQQGMTRGDLEGLLTTSTPPHNMHNALLRPYSDEEE